jgi:hypothetical protein
LRGYSIYLSGKWHLGDKPDVIFNGAAPMRVMTLPPGRHAGEGNGLGFGAVSQVIVDFDKSIINIRASKRLSEGASADLQDPENPLPLPQDQQQHGSLSVVAAAKLQRTEGAYSSHAPPL